MKADDVIKMLKDMKVEEALAAADRVDDRKEMAEKLTEFAGTLNYLKGKPKLTEVLLKKSLLLDSENPITHYNLGVLYSGLEMVEEDEKRNLARSEKAYRNALKYRPDFHEARYNLALLCYLTGRKGEAEAEYRKITDAVGDDLRFRDLGVMLMWDKREGRS